MFRTNKNPRHVYDVVRPLMVVSKFFGHSAFLIVGEPPYVQIKITGVEYASLVWNFLGNLCCVVININNSRSSRETDSAVLDLGLTFLFPMGAVIMFLLAIDNFVRRNITCTIIEELFKVDRSLQRKGYKLDHKRQYIILVRLLSVLLFLIAFGIAFSLAMSFISEFSLRNHLINSGSYAFTGVQFMIVNYNFVASARLIIFRLEAIKQCLKKHMNMESWWIEQKRRWGCRMEPIDVISEVADDFASLVRIIERINRTYSNQIICLIIGVGMYSIFVIYASSYSVYVGSTRESRLTAILLTAWVFYLIMVGLIFFFGTSVESASNDIVVLVHEAVQCENEHDSARAKLICFSQQILFRRPKLRCMFYDYDWKTLFSFFGFVVTYLVILLQFDKFSVDTIKGNLSQ